MTATYAFDPNAFFVGELNGEVISHCDINRLWQIIPKYHLLSYSFILPIVLSKVAHYSQIIFHETPGGILTQERTLTVLVRSIRLQLMWCSKLSKSQAIYNNYWQSYQGLHLGQQYSCMHDSEIFKQYFRSVCHNFSLYFF